MNFMDELSKRIVELREANGETQQELADAIGITRQTLSRYEIAIRTVDVNVLGALAQHFQVSTDYLLGLSDVKSTEQDMKTACDVTGLSEATIEQIQSFVRDFHLEVSEFNNPIYSEQWVHDRALSEEMQKLSNLYASKAFAWVTESEYFTFILEKMRDLVLTIIFEVIDNKNYNGWMLVFDELVGTNPNIRLCLLDMFDLSKSYARDIIEAIEYFDELEQEVTNNVQHHETEE